MVEKSTLSTSSGPFAKVKVGTNNYAIVQTIDDPAPDRPCLLDPPKQL